ncbi:MAG TPA: hypothetical protein VG167_22020 [Verrucomicrobiae bacterium]|nr:hypothetical protein [Verrucomicrobiae bacterium]
MVGKLGRSRARNLCILLAGLVLGQAILYGPSLVGKKILLPVDLLAQPATYLPRDSDFTNLEPQNLALSDRTDMFEPARRFATAEWHAGRLPSWAPYEFGGVPFIWPKFSPFLAFECLTASPVVLAWGQVLQALVAGLGLFLFCRFTLGVSFWPATIVSWCYPSSAFFVLWQGYPTCLPVVWLPWILCAVDQVARDTHRLAPAGLVGLTCLVLISGHLDVACQVLLAAGVFALSVINRTPGNSRDARRVSVRIILALGLGLLLALPYVLPVLDYSRDGARIARRAAGEAERPPAGLVSLAELILPHTGGSSQTGSLRITGQTESETAVAGYVGLVATLVAAPLAACYRRRRWLGLMLCLLAFIGLAWSLDVPGLVWLLRVPPLNFMSQNRLVFITGFSILALAAEGLEALRQGQVRLGRWWVAPASLLALLYLWCMYRTFHLPEAVGPLLEQRVEAGEHFDWLHDLAGVHRVQDWFSTHAAVAASLCAAALGCWVCLRWKPAWQPRLVAVLGVLCVAELIWFSSERVIQSDPNLYYPKIGALAEVAAAGRVRVIGWHCLPASLAYMAGLADVRGYDGVDPARMVNLLATTSDGWFGGYPYALTQWLAPAFKPNSDGTLTLPSVLNMLGVRYVVFRRPPPTPLHAAFHSEDYWVVANSAALPRVFVPGRVETISDEAACRARLGSAGFDPREVALVNSELALPQVCRGSAEVLSETPSKIVLQAQMQTAGLVVLGDNWDSGWRAWLDGRPAVVLRVNETLRGVISPAGSHRLILRYRPRSFYLGLVLSAFSFLCLLIWCARDRGQRRGPIVEARCG